jgi:hypothetical protein
LPYLRVVRIRARSVFAFLPAALVTLALSACGGSGGGGTAGTVTGPVHGPTETVLRIVVPSPPVAASSSRRPAFVSAGALSMSVAIYTVAPDGTIASAPASTTNVDLVPSSICSGTPLACTIVLDAPVGTLTFGVTLYSQVAEGGSVLATFAPSAVHEFTIVQNTNNTIGISLDGVPATMRMSVSPAVVTAGTAATATITVVAMDASNNVIIGTDPYAAPIQLTDNDPSGSTTLSSATVLSPASTVSLVYAGGPLNGSSFLLNATFPGTPPVLASTSVGVLNTNGITATPSTVSFLALSQAPQVVTYGEAAYNGTFTVVSTSCAGIATVLNLTGTFRVTPLAAGSCTVTVSDNANHWTNVTIGVTQSTVIGS